MCRWCTLFLSLALSSHTHNLLFLINTHINHAKYQRDKPIINLHHQVQYSDNEFSGIAVDSILSLTAEGCCNDCSMSTGNSAHCVCETTLVHTGTSHGIKMLKIDRRNTNITSYILNNLHLFCGHTFLLFSSSLPPLRSTLLINVFAFFLQ